MTRISLGRATAALVAGAVVLAGCNNSTTSAAPGATGSAGAGVPAASASPSAPAENGVAALAASEILKRAKAAVTQAKSFRLQGKMKEDGESVGLDFKIHGADVIGKMTMGGGAEIEVLSVGGKHYMRPNPKFWTKSIGDAKQGAGVAEIVGDRWVKVPAKDKDFGSLFSVADVNELLKPDGTVTKGATKQIDGTKAVGVVEKGSDGGTLWVAATGRPYPLRLDGPTAADGGLTFSEFGATFADIRKPASTDVIDFSKLTG